MQRYGCSDTDGISPFLKVAVTTEDGALQVMGYIGDGAAWAMVSSWESPFEGNSLGSISGVGTAANVAQAADWGVLADKLPDSFKSALGIEANANLSGMTSISSLTSMMVWQGGRPPALSLPIHFVAREDAAQEVQGALMALNQMISPELSAVTPGGRRPRNVIVNVGRMVALTGCVIQAVNMELDAPRTIDGYFTHNTVQLEISGSVLLNGSVIPQVIGMSPM